MKILHLDYDKEADVLYIAFDKPKPAIGYDHKSGAVQRRDMDTGEIVGYTIVNFSMYETSFDLEIKKGKK